MHTWVECEEYQEFDVLRKSRPNQKRLNRGTKRQIYWIRGPGDLQGSKIQIFYYSKKID